MGAGGLWEAGEEGAGGGISKRGGSREKWEIFHNIGTIFRNKKSTRGREPFWKGGGNRECRLREAGCSDPPVPPYSNATGRCMCSSRHGGLRGVPVKL